MKTYAGQRLTRLFNSMTEEQMEERKEIIGINPGCGKNRKCTRKQA